MALFKKKEKEEDYEDEYEEDEEEEPRRPLRRKFKPKDFKDLNPKDKSKRKEPPKPWGKKERFLVLGLILITVGISAFLGMSARDWKLPGLPQINFRSISLSKFFEGETIVIEGNSKDKIKASKAISFFNEKTISQSGVYGLYVLRLKDGSNYGVNEKEIFQAASLIKLPIMAGIYMEEERGALSLSSKYKLKNSDKVAGSGSLYSKPAGYEITYRNLIRLMGKESDNTAFNVCRKLLGDSKIVEIINKIGMKNTSLENNQTTPEDIGIFFDELWNGNIVKNDSKNELLGFMTDTIYENWLSAGIPGGVRIAHKFGREVHVINDAGIVYSGEPYIIVLMTKGIVEKQANEVIPELSKAIYLIETDERY